MEIIRENTLITPGYSKSLLSKNGKEFSLNKDYFLSKYNFIKTFDDNRSVILNTLTDCVALLSPQETQMLSSVYDGSCSNKSFMNKLFSLGIVIDDNKDEQKAIQALKREVFLSGNECPIITILPTQQCNARCEYCFAEHNQKITMTPSTVKQVIAFFTSNFKRGDKVIIRWFGGEPLVGEQVIDDIIDGINSSFDGELDFKSIMFSNGSLLSENMIEKAYSKWRLTDFHITIDGYGDEHNRRKNYPNSNYDYYSKALTDIKTLLDKQINVSCRVNLDKDNISQLDMILRDLYPYRSYKHFRVRVTVLRPSDCGYNHFNYIAPSDLSWAYQIIYQKLFEYGFLRNVIEILPRRMRQSCIFKNVNKIIIGADGNLYKCLQQTLSSENAVGSVENGIALTHFADYFSNVCIPDQCETCRFLPLCLGGCDAYWKFKETEKVSPCIREKYFIDLLLEFVHQWKVQNNE